MSELKEIRAQYKELSGPVAEYVAKTGDVHTRTGSGEMVILSSRKGKLGIKVVKMD